MTASVMWFRRDLRLHDNPALLAAADGVEGVVPLFVVDERLWGPSGDRRRAYLRGSVEALDASTGGALVVRRADPVTEVVAVARAAGASRVHVAADFQPYGRARDEAVERALADAGVELVRTGSPYTVAPGRLRKADGTPFRVYSPYHRAWLAHGWRAPAPLAQGVPWTAPVADQGMPEVADVPGVPVPGEAEARRVWAAFLASTDPRSGVAGYGTNRDRPDQPGTTRLSVRLKYGELHPRTVLSDLAALTDGSRAGADTLGGELAWRDFYADVLFHDPASAREFYKPQLAGMRFDSGPVADERLRAWQQGRTGYPIVDAGMRQLLAEGWMHNRVRMIVGSFLVKDLHLRWTAGARWFMDQLVDGELSSNQHGWQWIAGSGTDAAPYFRVFNPTTQGEKFDPHGDYVRTYVPELAHVPGHVVHTPWAVPGAYDSGYPRPVVDHAAERREALARYEEVRA